MERKSYNLNDGREINLRPLQGKDREQLEQLFHSMSQIQNGWTNLLNIGKIDQKFEFPDYFINLVTEHNNNVVGFGEIQKDPQKKMGELNIHVHEDFQGVGLGTAIMIILLKEATEQQLHHIDLHVAAGNRRAIHLFRKFGFQEQPKKVETPRFGEKDVIHMSKILTR
jgi:ribosomal protein S18 acetylase RimI-like enzyme